MCSSDGTSKEFVHSSPTGVQGQGFWENEFAEEARMAAREPGLKKGKKLCEPTHYFSFI